MAFNVGVAVRKYMTQTSKNQSILVFPELAMLVKQRWCQRWSHQMSARFEDEISKTFFFMVNDMDFTDKFIVKAAFQVCCL